jgi:hypothetical protein
MPHLITTAQQAVLRTLGDRPEAALSLHDVEQLLPQVKRVSACLFRLTARGWLQRERRLDEDRHRTSPFVTNFWRFYYWRSAAGTEMLARIDAGGKVWVLTPEEEAQRKYRRPDDDEALLQSYNKTRGAVTFRETMAAFGFTTIAEVRAMPIPTWRTFHELWTAKMKQRCAEAGEPIAERHPNDPWHGNSKKAPRPLPDEQLEEAAAEEDEAAA